MTTTTSELASIPPASTSFPPLDAQAMRPSLAKYIGGKRGFVDGALPPFAFIAVNALAGSFLPRPDALRAAVIAAVTTGLALVGLRLRRKEPLQQAIRGLIGLAIAALFAARSGDARDFFLPGIYVDAAWAVIFATSALVGRPVIGLIYGAVFGQGAHWRRDARLRRTFAIASIGWSLVYAARATAQGAFYQADQPGLLAASKLVLGWPLTIVALLLTVAFVRRMTASTNGRAGTAA